MVKPTYSYSQLNTFHDCPYAWSRLYLDHVPRSANFFAEYGTIIHSVLEEFAKGELQRDALRDVFEWRFDTEIVETPPYNKYVELGPKYRQQGLDFFENFEGFDGLEIIGVEQHFKLDFDSYFLQGFIDLVYRNRDGKLICRDWKSGSKWTKRDIAEHAKQLYLYSAYCLEAYGQYPDQMEFFHFREGNKKSIIPFKEEDYWAARRWADEMAEAIANSWCYEHHEDQFFCDNLCSCRSVCEFHKR